MAVEKSCALIRLNTFKKHAETLQNSQKTFACFSRKIYNFINIENVDYVANIIS